MEIKKYVVAGLVGTLIGVAGMQQLMQYTRKPSGVYMQDVNGDEKKDIVVQTNRDNRYVFIAQEDGSYKPLKEITQEQAKSIETKVQELGK